MVGGYGIAFGDVRVLVYDLQIDEPSVEQCDLDALLFAVMVSLHLHLTSQTRYFHLCRIAHE